MKPRKLLAFTVVMNFAFPKVAIMYVAAIIQAGKNPSLATLCLIAVNSRIVF